MDYDINIFGEMFYRLYLKFFIFTHSLTFDIPLCFMSQFPGKTLNLLCVLSSSEILYTTHLHWKSMLTHL